MNRYDCFLRLQDARAHISHDLFRNSFGSLLQPGWRDDVDPSRDVVVQALKGDQLCNELLGQAIEVWSTETWAAIDQLVKDVEERYGFVTSQEWSKVVKRLQMADSVIRTVNAKGYATPEKAASAFWAACRSVDASLASLGTRSEDYLVAWRDPGGGPR